MSNSTEHYLRQLQSLLPLGDAWTREEEATLTQFLYALAEEFARIDGRVDRLIEENDPRTTLEMLSDWETAFGLPEGCLDVPDTIEERHNALHEKVTRIGDQSRAYYIEIADRAGYVITITEFHPHTVDDVVDHPLYGQSWIYAWQVNAPEETVRYFNMISGVDEPLADWGNDQLECIIKRLKPAHTLPIFAYGG
jgi:uncharacterized protein YmfQ (DUF2313 family)